MATSPLGGFADLTAARARASAPVEDPLGALLTTVLTGAQQGNALVNLPTNIQNQNLISNLAVQLQQANVARQQAAAQEALNPDLALNRRLQEDALRAIVESGGRSGGLVLGGPSAPSDFQPVVPELGGRPSIGISPSASASFMNIKKPVNLEFRDVGDAVVGLDPSTGKEMSRVTKIKGAEYHSNSQGLFVTPDPSKPTETFLVPGSAPTAKSEKGEKIRTFDTKTGLYGVHEVLPGETLPEGIVPESQVPKPKQSKPLPSTQVDNLAAYNLLEKKIGDIESNPLSVRQSNVGWLDSLVGKLQSATGAGRSDTIANNDRFRSAVDALVGEFSFGRGGKALTASEKETLAKYIPSLTQSDAAFESRLNSFKNLVKELRESRIQSLEDSGYDVEKLKERLAQSEQGLSAPASSAGGAAAPGSLTPQAQQFLKKLGR